MASVEDVSFGREARALFWARFLAWSFTARPADPFVSQFLLGQLSLNQSFGGQFYRYQSHVLTLPQVYLSKLTAADS
jgi:hypothetical protein